MNSSDINFAYKIRHALNEQAENLPATTLKRLAQARQLAVSKRKISATPARVAAPRLVLHSTGAFLQQPLSWLGRFGVAAPLVLGAVMLFGVYHTTQQQRIDELAEVDIGVLSDELTLLAYLDTGFNAYLATKAE